MVNMVFSFYIVVFFFNIPIFAADIIRKSEHLMFSINHSWWWIESPLMGTSSSRNKLTDTTENCPHWSFTNNLPLNLALFLFFFCTWSVKLNKGEYYIYHNMNIIHVSGERISVILCRKLSIEETQGTSAVEGHLLYKTRGKYTKNYFPRIWRKK